MSEWWTYSLSDFLMFSPQVYWRLVARYNAAWWPAQCLGVAASCVLLAGHRWPRQRWMLALLALAWACVGWAFHAQRHAEIFLGATGVALACGVQALLLLAACVLPPGPLRDPAAPRAGLALLALAAAYPLLAPLTGHPWAEAEVFGFMPEPTALATLGVLLSLPHLPRRQLAVLALLPGASLLLGAATRWLLA